MSAGSLSFTVYAQTTSGCRVQGPNNFGLFGALSSTQRGSFVFAQKLSQLEPSTSMSQALDIHCNSANEFLSIAMAPAEVSIQQSLSYHFDGEVSPDFCHIQNNPFHLTKDHDYRRKAYQERFHFLNHCLDVILTETSGQALHFPLQQDFCKLEPLSDSQLRLHGGVCFINLRGHSRFQLKFELHPRCLNSEYLTTHNLSSRQVLSGLNLYIAGDASGQSPRLRQFSSHQIYTSIQESKAKDDEGHLSYLPTTTWTADAFLGQVTITPEPSSFNDGRYRIDVPIFWDNHGPENSRFFSHLYPQAVGAYLQAFLVRPDQARRVIDQGDFGGVIEGGWQGLLNARQEPLWLETPLQSQDILEFELTLSEPVDNYFGFLARDQRGLNMEVRLPREFTGGRLPGLPRLPTLEDLPQLPSMPLWSGGEQDPEADRKFQEAWSQFSTSDLWPPEIKILCHPSGRCTSNRNSGVHTRFISRYQVQSTNPSQPIELKHLESRITSHLFPEGYFDSHYPLPYLQCGLGH